MKSKNRIVAMLLTLIMVLGIVPMNVVSSMAVSASDFTEPTIFVDSKYSAANSTVTVDVLVANNPGVAGATLTVSYNQYLTLTSAENGEAFSKLSFTKSGSLVNPVKFLWDSESGEAKGDGTILTLTFDVSASAPADANLNIEISSNLGDFYDEDMETVNLQLVSGSVTVIDYIPGDVNGDGVVNGKDVTLVRRHIVGGYDQTINASAAEVNEDGTINGKDVTAIRRFIVGGYDIVLKPAKPVCAHHMTATAYKAATCTEAGNIAYWQCSECNKYFKDAVGTIEVSLDNTVIPAKGHTVVIDLAVAPTDKEEGRTEGSHCSECGDVIVEPQPIPIPQKEQYNITYDVANGDLYLASLDIDNPNENSYFSEDGYTLKNLSVPGYTFLGWYDLPAGENAENIKKISVGQSDDIELYAHWEKIEYTVNFESDLINADRIKYTVDESATLPILKLDGYVFVGWSDGDGDIYKTIPVGSTGNKTYTANWLSERNKAWTKNKLNAPIIVEDDETNTILFTYEIGRIENVPLYTIEDFGYINSEGVTRTVSKEYTIKTEETLMEQYSKNVANATTNSSQWALSSGWSDTVSANESYLTEKGLTETDAKTFCTTDNSNWLVSSGSSGSTTTTTYASSQDYDLNTNTGNTKTYDTSENGETHNNHWNAELDLSYEHKSGKVSKTLIGENNFNIEVSGGGGQDWGNSTLTKKGTEGDEGYSNQGGSIKHTGTDTVSTGSWNSSKSYGGSKSVSESSTVSKAVSEKIASEYGYGTSYIKTGGESSSQGISTSSSNSNTYSSAVTYSTEETTTETITYTTSNTKTGYHRLIKAGTAHVFAIVGYDIKTASFFVSTYTVMDDESHTFEDYSYSTALYDDNQTGVISFEVPYEVEEYVLSRAGETEGLEVSYNGVVTGYNGTEKVVVIPEYHVIDNLDGSKDVVKITAISENAFKGNTAIEAIELSDLITEVPNNAFNGCSNLSTVNMTGVTSIGDNAFANCTQLDSIILSDKITHLGNNAFNNAEYLIVNASSADVIQSAIKCNAKNVAIIVSDKCNDLNNITLEVPEITERFVLNGYGKMFNNLYINSEAKKTILNRVNVTTTKKAPLVASSEEVQLNQVSIVSQGFAMMLTNDSCRLGLYGESNLISANGKAILCKLIDAYQIDKRLTTKLHVNGDILICDEDVAYTPESNPENNEYIDFVDGQFVHITNEEFAKYVKGLYTLSFDANSGTVEAEDKEVFYGTAVGSLPTPTKTGFNFEGWYTEKSGGTKITEDTVAAFESDTTLYAHWTVNSFTATWSGGTGYTITVNRTSSPNMGASIGTLSSGDAIYYGDVLSVAYTASTGYSIATKGSSSITVSGNVTSNDIYATVSVNSYTVSWSAGTGTSITVNRTSSPKKGAATGKLSSGSTIYYGDVLSVTYSANTGYTLATKGSTSVTVTGNVTSSTIYATASLNSYTYNIVYKSSNGTNLGSTTATYKYGTTNTISAPAKSGYNTPSSQSVKWDSTSPKTITFTYTPSGGQASTQQIASGSWWWKSNYTHLDYTVEAQWRNRTANSVEINIHWTNTLTSSSGMYGYEQWFEFYGNHKIAESSKFASSYTGTRTAVADSGWITLPVSATDTSLYFSSTWWDNNSKSGGWSGTVYFPAY